MTPQPLSRARKIRTAAAALAILAALGIVPAVIVNSQLPDRPGDAPAFASGPQQANLELAKATTKPKPKPKPKPKIQTKRVPKPVAAPAERVVRTAYTTAYTWFDNTPAGSAVISNPVLHKKAGGTGTYADPVTIAVGHSIINGKDILDYPAGTRLYLPDVRRYFMVEDTCGDGRHPQYGPCHAGVNADGSGSTIWLDLWIGGQSGTSDSADDCTSTVTDGDGQLHTVVFNPASNYAVASGAGVFHDGRCDAGYGNTLVRK